MTREEAITSLMAQIKCNETVCHGLAGFYENEGLNILSDYCPNCGAKMEGADSGRSC